MRSPETKGEGIYRRRASEPNKAIPRVIEDRLQDTSMTELPCQASVTKDLMPLINWRKESRECKLLRHGYYVVDTELSLFLFQIYLSNSNATGTYHLLRHKEVERHCITFNKAKCIVFFFFFKISFITSNIDVNKDVINLVQEMKTNIYQKLEIDNAAMNLIFVYNHYG